jgi:hypothetical protein
MARSPRIGRHGGRPSWRALLCLARTLLAAPFGPSAMRFLATARRLGCQRRGFAREQARPVGWMEAEEVLGVPIIEKDL